MSISALKEDKEGFYKWLLGLTDLQKPSCFFKAMQLLDKFILFQIFRPISDLQDIPQDPKNHPEGDVFKHTMHVVDAMADICKREKIECRKRMLFILAALLHDGGKPDTTEFNKEKQKYTSYGHDVIGVPIAEKWLKSLELFNENEVLWICGMVRLHMVHCRNLEQITMKSAKKLILQLQEYGLSWEDLCLLMEADSYGRPPLIGGLSDSVKKMDSYIKELSWKCTCGGLGFDGNYHTSGCLEQRED